MESNEERIRREYRELEQRNREKARQDLIDSGIPERAKKSVMVQKIVRVCAKCGCDRLIPYKGIEHAYKCHKCGQWHRLDLD